MICFVSAFTPCEVQLCGQRQPIKGTWPLNTSKKRKKKDKEHETSSFFLKAQTVNITGIILLC